MSYKNNGVNDAPKHACQNGATGCKTATTAYFKH